jgi:F0F1-type ATP synthase delta subunit
MDQIDLTFFFKTKAEAADFSVRLAVITDEVYKTDFNLEQALTKSLGIQKKEKFITLLRDNDINAGAKSALLDFFGKVQAKIAAMQVATLTLALEPPEEMLQSLSEWFLLNINKQVLFDIKVDPALIAGATLTYNGKYKDYSIGQVVEKIIKNYGKPV